MGLLLGILADQRLSTYRDSNLLFHIAILADAAGHEFTFIKWDSRQVLTVPCLPAKYLGI